MYKNIGADTAGVALWEVVGRNNEQGTILGCTGTPWVVTPLNLERISLAYVT